MHRPKVLVVDDNEATCTLLVALLHNDFDVEVRHDGREAMEDLGRSPYDAVLLDLRMPRVDGYDVLEFIRLNHPAMLKKVLIVTAALGPRDVEKTRSYNVFALIPKPFDVEILLQSVKQCTGWKSTTISLGLLGGGVVLLFEQILRNRWM
ncbi:MAG TPA: response regulator [Thermoanaerobaculia bacterium]|nr:response regulator [Thermoanaerobaculia bacterium]